ncbi:MAG: FKBP-type peptidyl-prolyl cis-trans isomerase [Saprospiraceae bacterium]|nr:FKBP-type peptidyl-prolyl cis-trans isomerase [Saprospiraceae bacterium]
MDSLSYSLGILVGDNLSKQGFEKLDIASLADGLKAAITKSDMKLDQAAANQVVQQYMQKKDEAKFADAVANAAAFFAENGKKPGVKSLPSGLQYEVINAGSGASPGLTDKVTTHYHGTLLDGTVFDSSVDRGEPASFPVNGVIKGWTEALQLMKVGDKWRLYVPSDLAYGSRGAGAKIPPFTPLIFEVELISID